MKVVKYKNGIRTIIEIGEYASEDNPTITPEERIAEAEAKIAAARADIESAKTELLGIIDTMEVGV